MDMLADVLMQFLTPEILMMIVVGVGVGIIGGALPGISSTTTVALVATFAYTMGFVPAIVFLASTQVGSTYGGSITATVLNIPGTPASAATALEGYPMAKRGEGEKALAVNVAASFWGNTIGSVLLIIIMPFALKLALMFGSWEMFWFSVFAIVICAQLSRVNFLKGIFAACLGLIIAFVGNDPIYGAGAARFTFGTKFLRDGIGLIPAMVGLYGMSEVFESLAGYGAKPISIKSSKLFEFGEIWKYKWTALKVSILGFIIGVIPGVGSNIASWVGYNQAQRSSKNPESFGTGISEGLIGSEAANNACVPGTYAPLLSLGVPGDGVTAVVLSVLTVQGIQTGAGFMSNNPTFIWVLALSFILAGFVFLFIGTFAGRALVRLLAAPLPIILSFVIALCAMGSFGNSGRRGDIFLMFIFGIIGLIMKRNGFPIAPMIIGVVVGSDLVDSNFRRAVLAGQGDFSPFFTRPVSMVLILILALLLFKEFVWDKIKVKKAN